MEASVASALVGPDEPSWIIDVKLALLGARDLGAALTALAHSLAARPDVLRAVLVARIERMTATRVNSEWRRLLTVLRPELGARLGLVALAADRDVVLPEHDAELTELASRAWTTLRRSGTTSDTNATGEPPWSVKSVDVWKVLLGAWLRDEGPLAIQEVSRRSGCSHPTVTAVLRRLQSRGELVRAKSRAVALAGLPRRSLGEIVTLSDPLRRTRRFVDGSGRRPDPTGLLRRIRALGLTDVAIGGIEAARHHVTDFDLNGLPRIDLTVYGDTDLADVVTIDPALRPAGLEALAPILVIHKGRRLPNEHEWPFADPVETLLDLYDLRLTTQAEDFVRELRQKAGARA